VLLWERGALLLMRSVYARPSARMEP
jgi:hypothetical protein